MPPRPSTSSAADQLVDNDQSIAPGSPTEGQPGVPSSSAVDSGSVAVEDHLLPRTLTARLAKGVLPPNTQIGRDGVLALTKAATVFVSYLSSHANEATLKRTVSPEDVLNAISDLEFEDFLPRLKRELAVHAEAAAGKRKKQRQRAKDRESGAGASGAAGAAGAGGNNANNNNEEDGEEDADGERGTKRMKMEEGNDVMDEGQGKAGSGSSRSISVVIPNGQANSHDEMEDEEEEGHEEEEDEEVDDEGDEEEEHSEEEEEEEGEEDGTDPDEGGHRPRGPADMDSDLESGSDNEMESQLS